MPSRDAAAIQGASLALPALWLSFASPSSASFAVIGPRGTLAYADALSARVGIIGFVALTRLKRTVPTTETPKYAEKRMGETWPTR